ncbi:MAG: molybdopterin-binding protein [Thermoproteus sp. AZ2]|uniref:Molybdopterin-binding protein n=1 Tax=Thermoproteus sp. AZ2 TaxID=1609232 RepID=A0ACC6UZ37_9CREN|nr:MAG: molybdopterin-binding protein [Thermoproteus sp. AZ2]
MYALVRLRGYVEGVGYRAVVASDVADALGLKVGDAVRLEAPDGSSSARISAISKDLKSGIMVTADVYMALGAKNRAVLLKKVERAFEAKVVRIGVASDAPLNVEEVKRALSFISSSRIPIFTNFAGYFYTDRGWAKIVIKAVEPREPAYISASTLAHLG